MCTHPILELSHCFGSLNATDKTILHKYTGYSIVWHNVSFRVHLNIHFVAEVTTPRFSCNEHHSFHPVLATHSFATTDCVLLPATRRSQRNSLAAVHLKGNSYPCTFIAVQIHISNPMMNSMSLEEKKL